jgi:hypothetical protein
MSDPIRDLQVRLLAEEQRSRDLAAALADMGRVNGRLREALGRLSRSITNAMACPSSNDCYVDCWMLVDEALEQARALASPTKEQP